MTPRSHLISARTTDLRKDASRAQIATEVRHMNLSAINALLTGWIFRFGLLPRAYTREALDQLVAQSRFGTSHLEMDGVGFELQLVKQIQAQAKLSRVQAAA